MNISLTSYSVVEKISERWLFTLNLIYSQFSPDSRKQLFLLDNHGFYSCDFSMLKGFSSFSAEDPGLETHVFRSV